MNGLTHSGLSPVAYSVTEPLLSPSSSSSSIVDLAPYDSQLELLQAEDLVSILNAGQPAAKICAMRTLCQTQHQQALKLTLGMFAADDWEVMLEAHAALVQYFHREPLKRAANLLLSEDNMQFALADLVSHPLFYCNWSELSDCQFLSLLCEIAKRAVNKNVQERIVCAGLERIVQKHRELKPSKLPVILKQRAEQIEKITFLLELGQTTRVRQFIDGLLLDNLEYCSGHFSAKWAKRALTMHCKQIGWQRLTIECDESVDLDHRHQLFKLLGWTRHRKAAIYLVDRFSRVDREEKSLIKMVLQRCFPKTYSWHAHAAVRRTPELEAGLADLVPTS